jgi:hypothetical protein
LEQFVNVAYGKRTPVDENNQIQPKIDRFLDDVELKAEERIPRACRATPRILSIPPLPPGFGCNVSNEFPLWAISPAQNINREPSATK